MVKQLGDFRMIPFFKPRIYLGRGTTLDITLNFLTFF